MRRPSSPDPPFPAPCPYWLIPSTINRARNSKKQHVFIEKWSNYHHFPRKWRFLLKSTKHRDQNRHISICFLLKIIEKHTFSRLSSSQKPKIQAKRGKKRRFESKRGLVSRGSARKVTFYLFWKKGAKPLLEYAKQQARWSTFSKNRFSFRSYKNSHFTPKTAYTVIKWRFS